LNKVKTEEGGRKEKVTERKQEQTFFLEEEFDLINSSYAIQIRNEDWRSFHEI